MPDLSTLPPDFLWGVATSAYQIEGAARADGRKPSIWDTFCTRPGAIDNGDTGEVACDHYHRWPQDVALMRGLGVGAYRFSVAWPRVRPDGVGRVNPAGLDFYDRLVDALLTAGIRPYVTLYHWDLPQALQDRGGWPRRETAEAFADYAAVVAARLGDRVADWCTVNEPLCIAWIGHLEGRMAPGERDLARAVPAAHHVLLGHGLATAAIRANATRPASIGPVLNLSPIEPASDRPADIAAARRMDGHVNRWWLDPLHGRGYPADMVATYGIEPPVRGDDLAVIAAPTDFLGVNYYFRQVVTDDPDGPAPYARQVPVPGAAHTAMGWEVHPAGLEHLLVEVSQEYAPTRLLVTESGSAWPDVVAADGSVTDTERTDHLERHLAACAAAVGRGAPVAGYFAWSLLDNFEWAYGYDKRFGLVHVDYATQQRTVKASGTRYAETIRAHQRRAATVDTVAVRG
ncbi:beta-glucosidase [Micromonospora phaseoli]|uniref:Beta-glucosidase n=1 Tax=Micromonospora phaseoli TaxID=1144548 RepID=A0A1H6VBW6_9ACTN|nr:GH1 family beta-glucosidase [Micromonospora phaseoli]PZV93620.1 beta-glucosidase [Micromonospora phaseoli]GIJ79826.1 beta-glucosidase [Micromonospora phaseoli]SEJ02129.1 beta-glucosidase [Micromonospora phaseoli]